MGILSSASVMAFVTTSKPGEARAFYEDVLGLTFVEDSPFALVFDLHGTMLRIQKVGHVPATTHTTLGWLVADIRDAVQQLVEAGVSFERYDSLPQDDLGIWATPDGSAVAWFKDPDGNTLSLSQLSSPTIEVRPNR